MMHKTDLLSNKSMYAILINLGLLMLPVLCVAQDIGIKNNTYALDLDARNQIRNIVLQKYSTGEVQKFWNLYANKSVSMIKNPQPLSGISTDHTIRTELVEMKYSIEQDYLDANGRLIIKKGTTIEPLKIMNLKYAILFIDGRDQQQIDYALREIKRQPLKIVLTAGSAYELRVKYKNLNWMGSNTVPFYFDQRKMIIDQLSRLYHINIRTVPVKLTQKNSLLELSWGFAV